MEQLKKIRKENKYTATHMAQMLNISKPFYWQIENGYRRLSYEMAVRIADIFNMKPDDIFYEEFSKNVKKQS